jgi:hypothetical protein
VSDSAPFLPKKKRRYSSSPPASGKPDTDRALCVREIKNVYPHGPIQFGVLAEVSDAAKGPTRHV